MERKRSIGVTIFGWILIFFPVTLYIIPLVHILIKGNPLEIFFYYVWMVFAGSPLYFLTNLGYIIFGIGVLQLKKWAGIYVIYFILFGFLYIMIYPRLHPYSTYSYHVLAKAYFIIIHSLFIWFFTRPKVNEQFK